MGGCRERDDAGACVVGRHAVDDREIDCPRAGGLVGLDPDDIVLDLNFAQHAVDVGRALMTMPPPVTPVPLSTTVVSHT